MFRLRVAVMALALAGLGAGTVTAAAAGAAAGATAPAAPTLTRVRAAHPLGYDRGVPARRAVGYVSQVGAVPSGLPVNVAGSARLRVAFFPVTGHDARGLSTYGAGKRTYALPGIIQVVNAGDFEAVVSFGVGLARAEPFRMFTLTSPSRVVIDVRTPYRTVPGRDYFDNTSRVVTCQAPDAQAVYLPV